MPGSQLQHSLKIIVCQHLGLGSHSLSCSLFCLSGFSFMFTLMSIQIFLPIICSFDMQPTSFRTKLWALHCVPHCILQHTVPLLDPNACQLQNLKRLSWAFVISTFYVRRSSHRNLSLKMRHDSIFCLLWTMFPVMWEWRMWRGARIKK